MAKPKKNKETKEDPIINQKTIEKNQKNQKNQYLDTLVH